MMVVYLIGAVVVVFLVLMLRAMIGGLIAAIKGEPSFDSSNPKEFKEARDEYLDEVIPLVKKYRQLELLTQCDVEKEKLERELDEIDELYDNQWNWRSAFVERRVDDALRSDRIFSR